MWFVLNIYFPFVGLEFWCMLSKGCLHVQLPIKTLVTWSLLSFPYIQPFAHVVTVLCTCCHNLLLELCDLCDSTGREPLEASTWFLPDLAHAPPLSDDSALLPFPVLNLSHEYNYTLIPMGHSSETSSLGMVLGTSYTGTNLQSYPKCSASTNRCL